MSNQPLSASGCFYQGNTPETTDSGFTVFWTWSFGIMVFWNYGLLDLGLLDLWSFVLEAMLSAGKIY